MPRKSALIEHGLGKQKNAGKVSCGPTNVQGESCKVGISSTDAAFFQIGLNYYYRTQLKTNWGELK